MTWALLELRVRHDNTGMGAGWHLDSVEVRHRESGQTWSFVCRRWLAEDEDDGAILRELPAEACPSLPFHRSFHPDDLRDRE